MTQSKSKIRLTLFQVHKMKSIVGLGGSSPYQISTYPGDSLGMIGKVVQPQEIVSANGDRFEIERNSVFSRLLTKLGLKSS